jgi:hypothetical protein
MPAREFPPDRPRELFERPPVDARHAYITVRRFLQAGEERFEIVLSYEQFIGGDWRTFKAASRNSYLTDIVYALAQAQAQMLGVPFVPSRSDEGVAA